MPDQRRVPPCLSVLTYFLKSFLRTHLGMLRDFPLRFQLLRASVAPSLAGLTHMGTHESGNEATHAGLGQEMRAY